jgi:hypothetical protein
MKRVSLSKTSTGTKVSSWCLVRTEAHRLVALLEDVRDWDLLPDYLGIGADLREQTATGPLTDVRRPTRILRC